MYRLLRGYVYLRDTIGPVAYFSDLGRWDNIAHDATNAMMTWLGDGLAVSSWMCFLIMTDLNVLTKIYRCYIVWDNNIWIVILPICLMIISISKLAFKAPPPNCMLTHGAVSNSVALHLFTLVPLGTIFSPTLVHWMNTLYSVALVQNVFTTTLIAFRIYSQERASMVAGIRGPFNGSNSLMPIVRIIVESAMGYTAILVVLITLYALNNNGQYIMQEMSVPSVGKDVFCFNYSRILMIRS
jgi:hypothetical protein